MEWNNVSGILQIRVGIFERETRPEHINAHEIQTKAKMHFVKPLLSFPDVLLSTIITCHIWKSVNHSCRIYKFLISRFGQNRLLNAPLTALKIWCSVFRKKKYRQTLHNMIYFDNNYYHMYTRYTQNTLHFVEFLETSTKIKKKIQKETEAEIDKYTQNHWLVLNGITEYAVNFVPYYSFIFTHLLY